MPRIESAIPLRLAAGADPVSLDIQTREEDASENQTTPSAVQVYEGAATPQTEGATPRQLAGAAEAASPVIQTREEDA